MSQNTSSPVFAAAPAVALELNRFDETQGGFKRLSLSSKKNFNKASTMLNELGEIESQIGLHVQSLVKAIGGAGEAQLARVSEVKARAEQLQARAVTFNALTAQLGALGSWVAPGELTLPLRCRWQRSEARQTARPDCRAFCSCRPVHPASRTSRSARPTEI